MPRSKFLYQDGLNVVAQLDGNLVARYVFGSKPNVPDCLTTSAGTFRIFSDHLGSPRLIVNTSSGAVVEEIDYDEFGVVTNDTAPGTIPFGFAGGLYDKDTGLVRFGARDYDASVGRWTSKDPIGFGGRQINLYAYVGNDPVDGIDPVGRAGTFSCDIGPINVDEHGSSSFNLFPAPRNVSTRLRQRVREFYEGRACPRAARGARSVVASNAPGEVSARATVRAARWLGPEASARRGLAEGQVLVALTS